MGPPVAALISRSARTLNQPRKPATALPARFEPAALLKLMQAIAAHEAGSQEWWCNPRDR